MKIEQFYIFSKVVETLSIRKASQLCYTSPQNVSKEMIALERELGVRLYDRTSKGIVLTRDGERAYSKIMNVLRSVDKLKAEFKLETQMNSAETYPVTIFSDALCSLSITDILRSLMPRFPGANLRNFSQSRSHIFDLLKGNDTIKADILSVMILDEDIPMISSRVRSDFRAYSTRRWTSALNIPDTMPESRRSILTSKEVQNLPILLFASTPQDLELQMFELQRYGIRLDNINVSSDAAGYLDAALQHGQCSFGGVNMPSVFHAPIGTSTVELSPAHHVNTIVLIRKDAQNSSFTSSFLAAIRDLPDSSDFSILF